MNVNSYPDYENINAESLELLKQMIEIRKSIAPLSPEETNTLVYYTNQLINRYFQFVLDNSKLELFN